jgi:hypothetical protein
MWNAPIRNGLLLLLLSIWGAACAQGSGTPSATSGGTGGTAGGAPVATSSGGATASGAGGGSASGTGGASGGVVVGGGSGGSGGSSAGTGGSPGGIIHSIDLTGKKVLFIVDDPTSLDDGDIMLRDMMTAKGMLVTMGGTAPAGGVVVTAAPDLVVGSSGAAGAEFATLYKNSAAPVLTFGNGYFQPLDFIATSAARGNAASTVMLTVVDATSHLAAGFAAGATLAVISPTRNTQVYWASPAGAPIRIAQIAGNPGELCAFAYEKGAMMSTAPAPGRRVSLCWKTDAIKDLAVDSYRLMNAAIEWTAGDL